MQAKKGGYTGVLNSGKQEQQAPVSAPQPAQSAPAPADVPVK